MRRLAGRGGRPGRDGNAAQRAEWHREVNPETLLRDRSQVDERSERALHDAVVSLIDDALQMELVHRKLPIPARRTADLAQVQVYVMDRLSDKALCAKRVAAAFGISRRSLTTCSALEDVAACVHSAGEADSRRCAAA
jgi:hypothetical protein